MVNVVRSAVAVLFVVMAGGWAVGGSQPIDPVKDGFVRSTDSQSLQAWDAMGGAWVNLEQFWLNYVARNGGLTWGRGADYPPYERVKEHDTFMDEGEHGPCLMEFFHRRWRRANDVRRWDDAFNQYGGCAHVFD